MIQPAELLGPDQPAAHAPVLVCVLQEQAD
jgi:hypothetical protein